jgi:hypothetical protein
MHACIPTSRDSIEILKYPGFQCFMGATNWLVGQRANTSCKAFPSLELLLTMTAVPEYNLALDELSIALSFATGVVISAAPAPLVKAAAPTAAAPAAAAPTAVTPVPKEEETKIAKKVRI